LNPEAVSFYSTGIRLAGDLYLPETEAPSERGYPTVVLAQGWGGIKKFFVPDISHEFNKAGFASLAFDYRGFGASDGARNRLFPLERVADVRAAVAWLSTRAELDIEQVAVYGSSFGGGIALVAAACDRRIKVAASVVGIADCERWLRGLRPFWQWREFERRLQADELRRVLTGESEVVEPDEVMVRDPASLEHERMLLEHYPDRRFFLTLESAQAIREFKPIECVGQIAPRGTMIVAVVEDVITPYEHSLELFEHASEPKRLLTLSGLTHHEIYTPRHLPGVVAAVAAFCREVFQTGASTVESPNAPALISSSTSEAL
jgi:pimeloyl-ACP methyl ester carboxylesterase